MALAILNSLADLESVMLLTRNDAVVHELHHQFQRVYCDQESHKYLQFNSCSPVKGTVYHRLSHYHYAFAVNENSRLSLQFFDSVGQSLHKVFVAK